MKEYYGAVSIIARLNFRIEAENEEEAREKIYSSCLPIGLEDEDGKEIEVTEVNWEFVYNSNRGNVQHSHIEDFEIYEE